MSSSRSTDPSHSIGSFGSSDCRNAQRLSEECYEIENEEEYEVDPDFLISPRDCRYDRTQSLDSGKYSTVFKGQYKETDVAIKVANNDNEDLIREMFFFKKVILAKREHPNWDYAHCVVNCFGLVHSYMFGNTKLVMEFIDGKSLDKVISNDWRFSLDFWNDEGNIIATDIAKAIVFLDRIKILHNDLKPKNVVIYSDSDGVRRAKVIDLNLSDVNNGRVKTDAGSALYMSYERLGAYCSKIPDTSRSAKGEVFAQGLMIMEMLTGVEIDSQYKLRSVKELYDHRYGSNKWPQIPKCSPTVHQLLYHSLFKDPNQRAKPITMVRMLERDRQEYLDKQKRRR